MFYLSRQIAALLTNISRGVMQSTTYALHLVTASSYYVDGPSCLIPTASALGQL
jgi:hypothetical protein